LTISRTASTNLRVEPWITLIFSLISASGLGGLPGQRLDLVAPNHVKRAATAPSPARAGLDRRFDRQKVALGDRLGSV